VAVLLWSAILTILGCGSPTTPSSSDGSDGLPPLPAAPTALDRELAGCPTAADLASVADVKVFFQPAIAAPPFVCRSADGSADLSELQKKIYQQLIMMKRLRFSRPLPWTDKTLYEWFSSTVAVVEVDGYTGYSHADRARRWIYLVYDPNPEGKPAYPEYRWYSIASGISGMIHEARHIDGGPHTCTAVRDHTVAEMRADGAQNSYFTWLAEYSDPAVVPAEYKALELWLACTQRKKMCDEPKNVSCRQ
jgi:hypothetical protein